MDIPGVGSIADATQDSILVRFAGPGAGSGELTWGQRSIFLAMQANGSSLSMAAAIEVPAGKTAEDLADELAFMMGRYESMRTRLRVDADGTLTQVVSGSGEIAMTVLDVADGGDPGRVAQELADRWTGKMFDYVGEWPMRMAAVRHRGVTTHMVLCLCHLASDGGGVTVMLRELAERDPLTGQAKTPVTAPGPLELALRQREPAALRQSANALRHWEQVLTTVRPQRFGSPVDRGEPRYREVGCQSPALQLASQIVAARAGTTTATVVLAAYLVAMGRLTGASPVLTQVIVSNRFRPGLADASYPLCENTVLLIDVADCAFDEVVDRTQRASTVGSKHAYYDPIGLAELRARVERDRAEPIDIASVFNNRRQGGILNESSPQASRDEVRAAVDRRTLSWNKPMAMFAEKIMISIDDVPDTTALRIEMDTRYVSPADAEALLLDIETIVVEAAIDPQTPTRVKS